MQFPPLLFFDLGVLLAVGSIFLVITTELLSNYYAHTNILIDKKKMRNTVYGVSVASFITAAIHVIMILL